MKKQFTLIAALVLVCNLIFAQSSDADKIQIFSKPKLIANLPKLAISQITIKYKLVSTAKTIGKDKRTGVVAGAKLSAYLETTDGALTNEDFKEITDDFYNYFQNKLKSNNIQTVDWAAITATDFYQNQEDREDKKSNGSENVWVAVTANNGKELYRGGVGFSFLKLKKAAKFCEDLGATAGFFNLTVDFADLLLDLEVNQSKSETMFTSTTTRSKKYTWAVNPVVNVDSPIGALNQVDYSMLIDEKLRAEMSSISQPIYGTIKYADSAVEDSSKLKNSLWAFRKEMQPVVVLTTKAKYKVAAKEALQKYADAFVAKALQLKKN